MTKQHVVDATVRAADLWLDRLSVDAQDAISRHDRLALKAALVEAMAPDGIEHETPPKAGDLVRWCESDQEIVATKVDGGRVWGPWSEDDHESHVPIDEVLVVEPGPGPMTEGWAWMTEAPFWWSRTHSSQWVCGAYWVRPEPHDAATTCPRATMVCYSDWNGGWVVIYESDNDHDRAAGVEVTSAPPDALQAVIARGRVLLGQHATRPRP